MCRFNLLLTRNVQINCSRRQILFLSLFCILFYVIIIIFILFIYLFLILLIFFSCMYFSEKIKLDTSCESPASQTILAYMKCQVLSSLKNNLEK